MKTNEIDDLFLVNDDTQQNKEESIIKVIGVGGGGGNAINHMFRKGIKGVDFVICNTDLQALDNSPVPLKIQLGKKLTEGRGAGNRPDIGEKAALESLDEIKTILEKNTKMVFITAGMGGGTGTGATPVIAKVMQEMDILTIGIITVPFQFEGNKRIRQAMRGIKELQQFVDALLIIDSEKLRKIYGNLVLSKAFGKADNILSIAARSIAEIITVPGYINVDFADVETVMRNSGVAIMGSSISKGSNRAIEAVNNALNSPLLNNGDISGANNVLLNVISGTEEVSMHEITTITNYIQKIVGNELDIIWGNGTDESLGESISVTIIATGFVIDEENQFIPKRNLNEKPQRDKLELIINNLDHVEKKIKRNTSLKKNAKRRTAKLSDINDSKENLQTWFQRKFGGIFEEDKDTEMN